jgi:hypothetical protein
LAGLQVVGATEARDAGGSAWGDSEMGKERVEVVGGGKNLYY